MNVLFCALHFAYYRNFESVIRELAERGHRVHLAADEPEMMGGSQLVERLTAECPGVTFGFAPPLGGVGMDAVCPCRSPGARIRPLP